MKQQLSKPLYSLRIDNANKWNIIFQTSREELENKKATYINLNKKYKH
jgi:hypothetical protein